MSLATHITVVCLSYNMAVSLAPPIGCDEHYMVSSCIMVLSSQAYYLHWKYSLEYTAILIILSDAFCFKI